MDILKLKRDQKYCDIVSTSQLLGVVCEAVLLQNRSRKCIHFPSHSSRFVRLSFTKEKGQKDITFPRWWGNMILTGTVGKALPWKRKPDFLFHGSCTNASLVASYITNTTREEIFNIVELFLTILTTKNFIEIFNKTMRMECRIIYQSTIVSSEQTNQKSTKWEKEGFVNSGKHIVN